MSAFRPCPADGTARSVAGNPPVRRKRARPRGSAARRGQPEITQLAAGGPGRSPPWCLRACTRGDRQVFINQYVVDDETQTSGFGAYSLTYLGVSLAGHRRPDGRPPAAGGRTTCASSPRVRGTPPRGAPRPSPGPHLAGAAGRPAGRRDRGGRRAADPDPGPGRAHRAQMRARPPPLPHRPRRRAGQRRLPVRGRAGGPVRGRVGGVLRPGRTRSTRCARPTRCVIAGGFYSPRVVVRVPRPGRRADRSPAAAVDRAGHQVPARRARRGRPSGS